MAWTRDRISEATGFDRGDEFESADQVRAYFTAENVRAMFGECSLTQAELDEMAETVIEHRWHMTPDRDDLFAEALGFDDYEDLMAASEPIVREGDVDWHVTQLPDGRWAAWDDAELTLDRVAYFDTREEAAAFHRDAARSAGLTYGEK